MSKDPVGGTKVSINHGATQDNNSRAILRPAAASLANVVPLLILGLARIFRDEMKVQFRGTIETTYSS